MRTRHRKLRLHRESLRRLDGITLNGVAGAGHTHPCAVDDPKSNAWTGKIQKEAGCTIILPG